MQILQGLIGMVLGFLIIVFRPQIKDFTGNLAFAETYLGSGGTWTFLVLLGLGTFIFSLMWALGTFQEIATKTLGPLL